MTVPVATGGVDFSVRGSNTHGEERLTGVGGNTIKRFVAESLGNIGWGQSGIPPDEDCD